MSERVSSSSSESEETTTIVGDGTSVISGATQPSHQRHREVSATQTADLTSIAETRSVRSASPASSQTSQASSRKQSDRGGLATTTNTATATSTTVTSNVAAAVAPPQAHTAPIPVLPPPVQQQHQQQQHFQQQHLHQPQQQQHFQHQQLQQQHFHQPHQLQQQPQPHFDVAKAIFTQVDTNRDGSISRDEFRQWAQAGNQAGGQFQQQHTQFAQQFAAQQGFKQPFGANDFKDVVLNIDYGAIEAYNIGFESAGDLTAEHFSAGVGGRQQFDVAKAIFTQVDTNRDGAISRDEFRHWAQGSQQNVGAPRFDAAKAMFNQADSNRDGRISRDEFRHWAQGGPAYPTQQAATNHGNTFNHAALFSGASPDVASILQQSGLGQGYSNYA